MATWGGAGVLNITTTASTSANLVWNTWAGSSTTITTGATLSYPAQPTYVDPAVLAEREAQQARAAEQMAARAAEEEAAEERAHGLLHSLLTPEQRAAAEDRNEIPVQGSEGGLFVIELGRGIHGNIREVDDHGCCLARGCVAPGMRDEHNRRLPTSDALVGQLLAARFDEPLLRRSANWSDRRPCRVTPENMAAVAA